MSKKLNYIPDYKNYQEILKEMDEDFDYRFNTRREETIFGRPLYYNINVQMVITQACPFNCSFCIEKINPTGDKANFPKQLESLKKILEVHDNIRLTITGGEPGLYVDHIDDIKSLLDEYNKTLFACINSTGYNNNIKGTGFSLNISDNNEVSVDKTAYPDACLQTIFEDKDMTVKNIKKYMDENIQKEFSFRFLTEMDKSDYDIKIFNEIKDDKDIKLKVFRVGDFFVYLTGIYKGNKFRITLGDMKTQHNRNYNGTYSNIIITPNGEIKTNWNNQK